MTESIKQDLLSNRFVDSLYFDQQPDLAALASLRRVLVELAGAWRDTQLVDREVAQRLHILSTSIPVQAQLLVDRHPELAHNLVPSVQDVELLIEACFDGGGVAADAGSGGGRHSDR